MGNFKENIKPITFGVLAFFAFSIGLVYHSKQMEDNYKKQVLLKQQAAKAAKQYNSAQGKMVNFADTTKLR